MNFCKVKIINRILIFIAILGTLVSLTGQTLASANSSWIIVNEKPGWGNSYLDINSILQESDPSEKEKGVVVSANVKTELSSFGAGFFAGYMQALQKKNPELYPGVDFSKVKYILYKHYFNIKKYSIATESIKFYDVNNNLICQPDQKLTWSLIEADSDDDKLIKVVIETLTDN